MTERTDDPEVIEHRLLELVYTTDAPITVPALAYFSPCSLEAAESVLDNLVARGRLHMEVGDDGAITYTFPNRHKFTALNEPVLPPGALVPHRPLPPAPLAIRGGRQARPLLAATLSLVIPGAGQLYTGNVLSAILWFVLVTAGYGLILPGILLHLFCIAAAAGSAYRLNASLARLALERS